MHFQWQAEERDIDELSEEAWRKRTWMRRERRKERPSDIVRLEGENLSKVLANELRELPSSLPAAGVHPLC